MADQVTQDLLANVTTNYLVLVMQDDGKFDYIWAVADDEVKKKFQRALQQFVEGS